MDPELKIRSLFFEWEELEKKGQTITPNRLILLFRDIQKLSFNDLDYKYNAPILTLWQYKILQIEDAPFDLQNSATIVYIKISFFFNRHNLFLGLPTEILFHIQSFLSPLDTLSFLSASSFLYRLSHLDDFWRSFGKQHFGLMNLDEPKKEILSIVKVLQMGIPVGVLETVSKTFVSLFDHVFCSFPLLDERPNKKFSHYAFEINKVIYHFHDKSSILLKGLVFYLLSKNYKPDSESLVLSLRYLNKWAPDQLIRFIDLLAKNTKADTLCLEEAFVNLKNWEFTPFKNLVRALIDSGAKGSATFLPYLENEKNFEKWSEEERKEMKLILKNNK